VVGVIATQLGTYFGYVVPAFELPVLPWPLYNGILFREDVPIRNTHGGNILKGLIYSVIMSIISIGILVPYAYVPKQGYGPFLFDGPDRWKLPFAILVWHLIYGFFLGLLYQPADDSVDA
jgi:hypothetical protein